MRGDVVVTLLPVLRASEAPEFNVFDVMRHGTHEKQLSNVFAWLLDAAATHGLGGRFLTMFIEAVNRRLDESDALPLMEYVVRQEVNVAREGAAPDIADIVLHGDEAVVVVENYETSDGHGHRFANYQAYAGDGRARGAVVLLCQELDPVLQGDGWEKAAVVTYEELVRELYREVADDAAFRRAHESVFMFIEQIYAKFVERRGAVSIDHTIDFVAAMCATGEARRYQQAPSVGAEQFAVDYAQRAKEQFQEGRELLREVKAALRAYAAGPLLAQLRVTLGAHVINGVSANYQGIYQWTVNFDAPSLGVPDDEAPLQIKFGPSAWYANESDDAWVATVPRDLADYSYLFVTRRGTATVRQATVTLAEVLDGLAPDDMRLHDDLVALVQ